MDGRRRPPAAPTRPLTACRSPLAAHCTQAPVRLFSQSSVFSEASTRHSGVVGAWLGAEQLVIAARDDLASRVSFEQSFGDAVAGNGAVSVMPGRFEG